MSGDSPNFVPLVLTIVFFLEQLKKRNEMCMSAVHISFTSEQFRYTMVWLFV